MKRLLLGIGALGVAAILGGCPIYPDQNSEVRVCNQNSCYSCPNNSYSGSCIAWSCSTDGDCGEGYACSDQGQCVPSSNYGYDSGVDCSTTGCSAGYVCKLSNGVASCVSSSEPTSDAGVPDGLTDASIASDAPAVVPEGGTGDAGDAAHMAVPCNADTDCTASGSRCIDGACVAQVELCSDGTQCNTAGSSCVNGVCEPACSATVTCPSGYSCDFTRGVCNVNTDVCSLSGANACQGGAACVEGHCVPPCASTDEGGAACASGLICVNGGCIPDQGVTFRCTNDGDEGQLANSCAAGQTCLHHDCYTACQVDASPPNCGSEAAVNPASCVDVTIETGTYAVCAPSGMLGSSCDPAQGKACAGPAICVNGFCK